MNTSKYKFCEQVLKFLREKYQDAYTFEIEYYMSPGIQEMELRITVAPGFVVTCSSSFMQHLFTLYYTNGASEWQKELIKVIEG